MKTLLQDLRYGARMLVKSPGFTAVAVLSLALGIGANSAIFSVLNTVMLRSLAVPDPDQLSVILREPGAAGPQRFPYPMLERLRGVLPPDAAIAGMSRIARVHTTIGSARQKESTRVQLVSGEYFSVLGLHPVTGRFLTPDDNRIAGTHALAVISHGFWQRRLGASPDVLGSDLTLNGTRFTIIGIAPQEFAGVWLEDPTDIWIPIAMQSNIAYSQNFSAGGNWEASKPWMYQEEVAWLELIVRTKPEGIKPAEAAVNTLLQQQLRRDSESISDPEERRRFLEQRLALDPFGRGHSNLRDRFATPLFTLMAMVGLVLLIACANTANLLLARATGRSREMAVRLSVGASRGRLVRQLLTESFLLTAIAATLGLLLAAPAGELLVHMTLGKDAPPVPVEMDASVLAFSLALSALTAILFGLAPAFRATKVNLSPALKSAEKSVLGGARFSAAKLLVASQVALSLLLVVGATLFARSLRNLMQLDVGFDREHLVSVSFNAHLAGYSREQAPALQERLAASVEALPGVRSVSFAMCGLIAGCRSRADVVISGYQGSPGEEILVQENHVSDGYFSTVGMRLIDGRDFDNRDKKESPRVVIVNEALVRRYFQGRSAIGERLGYDKPDVEIIGVVEDARVNSVQEAAMPMAFYSLRQSPVFANNLDVRTAGDPQFLVAELTKTIAAVDPNLPLERITTLKDRVSANLNQESVVVRLTSGFGLLALGLACLGLYGVMSYAVARRTSELGIRMALGAPRSHVLWIVFRESLSLVALGLAFGLPLVLVSTRLLSSMLFGISANDPLTIGAATAVLIVVAALSGYLPARRAAAVDPLVALRYE